MGGREGWVLTVSSTGSILKGRSNNNRRASKFNEVFPILTPLSERIINLNPVQSCRPCPLRLLVPLSYDPEHAQPDACRRNVKNGTARQLTRFSA